MFLDGFKPRRSEAESTRRVRQGVLVMAAVVRVCGLLVGAMRFAKKLPDAGVEAAGCYLTPGGPDELIAFVLTAYSSLR